MIISNGGIERVLGPHLQKLYKPGSVEKSRPVTNVDSVSISAEARLAQAARSAIAQLPAVREDRVQALKQALSGGQYRPSDDAIAATIMGKRV